jgi:hypothetical protein
MSIIPQTYRCPVRGADVLSCALFRNKFKQAEWLRIADLIVFISGIKRHAVIMYTDVLEEGVISIFRVKNQRRKEPSSSETSVHIRT